MPGGVECVRKGRFFPDLGCRKYLKEDIRTDMSKIKSPAIRFVRAENKLHAVHADL